MKAIYLLVLLIVVWGCKPTGQQENQQLMVEPDDDVSCEPPSEYACHPVYPGPDDTEDLPPAVCGCTPRCEGGTFLDVGVGEGNNPDGTRKGVFSCK